MRRFSIFLISLIWASFSFANNIEVSNVSLTGQNTGSDYTFVNFDLSWENSWRLSVGPSNWDAAWVFVKFRVNSGDWRHATLNYVDGTNDGHIGAPNSSINTPSDGVGAFIYRSTDGSGDVDWQNIQLRWNYGVNSVGDDDLVDVQVFAIEMVYCPTGSFRIGDLTSSNTFYPWPFSGSTYAISSENQINVGTAFGSLYYADSVGSPGDRLGPIPAAFPKGHQAFYSMKYEVTQDQYVCFFNTLTIDQKTTLDVTDVFHKGTDAEVGRNSISFTGGAMSTATPNRAMNYIGNDDVFSYLDWSGLRPMTELEYEKACRGSAAVVRGEFAWGNANIAVPAGPYTVVNDGEPGELVADPAQGVGNVAYLETMSGFGGPLRVGIFAASSDQKNREETGGSYYGIMELSGNLYERCITVGHPVGRAFIDNHGNGALQASGAHNVATWPPANDGMGFKGASYINQARFLRVSDRYDAANGFSGTNSRIGFRGVRTAQ